MNCPLDYWFNLGSKQWCPDYLSKEDGTSPYSVEQRLKICINRLVWRLIFSVYRKTRRNQSRTFRGIPLHFWGPTSVAVVQIYDVAQD